MRQVAVYKSKEEINATIRAGISLPALELQSVVICHFLGDSNARKRLDGWFK